MPSRCHAAVCRAAVFRSVVLLALGASFSAHAQTPPSGEAAINNAISDAVKEGGSPYRPAPRPPTNEDPLMAECRQLLAEINKIPKRVYRPAENTVENSQGTDIPTVERDRSRRQAQRAFDEKCGH